ncbi:sensor histidine kinase [Arthrobacter caoxuetaonis]|uniref:histidine kinase n=1 Tax=Arthrobacter caoxuetaonis TaxID=2886935 RepID=A0A9X1SBY7_9MICC|nr:histidine kinase [Arthrobacter caoxuetaonis]MCC3280777.1 histidine kinase [Arthrobacter caoxuetaonis]MCC3296982.1 histidine kinase [Arthrobacter caoxuetaonis]USQ56207.1 histidine kinase [Arthrobacter caoxuetaonis]
MLLHQRIYAWMQANPFKVDLAGAVLATLVFAFPFLLGGSGSLVEFALSAAITMPLAWRRTRPVPAAAVQAAACLIQLPAVPVTGLFADIFVLPMVYALAAYAPRWASLAGLLLAMVGGVLFVLQYFFLPSLQGGALTMQLGGTAIAVYLVGIVSIEAIVLVCWTLGDLARTRRLAMESLRDRARRLEVERQQERDLAAADERTHIAREMHDIVAHSLSVIITQADGARYASAANPDIAVSTLGTIAETGRGSLREMRRLLGVLRGDEHSSTRPLPTLADVGDLVEGVKRAGLDVQVRTAGSMRRALPAGAELTAYRVMQESLTNVLKHAGPQARAWMDLEWTPRGLALTVQDDGRGAGADQSPAAASSLPDGLASQTAGPGQGINGMRERLALYDGTLEASPVPGGGFRVAAFIPYTEA